GEALYQVRDPTAQDGGLHGAPWGPTLTSLSSLAPSELRYRRMQQRHRRVAPQPAALGGHGHTAPWGDDQCCLQRKETAGAPWRGDQHSRTGRPTRAARPARAAQGESQSMSSVLVVGTSVGRLAVRASGRRTAATATATTTVLGPHPRTR